MVGVKCSVITIDPQYHLLALPRGVIRMTGEEVPPHGGREVSTGLVGE